MFKNTLLLSALLVGSTSLLGCNLYFEEGLDGPGRRGGGTEVCRDGACGWVPDSCDTNEECGDGCYCTDGNTCAESDLCEESSQCGEGFECDYRGSCVPGDEPEPEVSCQSEVSCDVETPICPIGSTAAILGDCFTGECIANEECPDGAPFTCADLNTDEAGCLDSDICGPVYKGVNCSSPSGADCTSGSADCSCESFEFDYCE